MPAPVAAVKSSKSAMERPVKSDLQGIKQGFIFKPCWCDNPR
jgi:hypothetical protein|tara:strand:+ start:117 stop:242 length:126 start_codon:yes stop_codon:yes gene_type:complete